MKHSLQKGFTLIELILVVAILAILTGLLLTIVNPVAQFRKANDTRRKSDLAQLQRALEQYYQDHGQYPKYSTQSPLYEIVDFSNVDKNPLPGITWGNAWQPYMNFLPKDPDPTRRYIYVTDASFQTYWIYASLEQGSADPQACNKGFACSNVPSSTYCGNSASDVCNYGVSSTNTTP